MKKEVLLFATIIFFGVLFEFVGWFNGIRAIGQKYSVPFSKSNAQLIALIAKPYDYLLFSFSKSKYMKELEVKYAQALSKLNELDALRAENTELKQLLGANDRTIGKKTILGAPIVSLALPAIGVGSADGVQEKDMVLISGVLVGTVEEVTEYQSKISLLTSRRKNRILVRTESGVEGVIDGDGRNVLLTHIPRSVTVSEGERVVTVGQEGIERNMLIGTIQRSETNPSDATQTFVVSQIVSFYTAVLVEVQ